MQISINESVRAAARRRPRQEPNGGKVKNVQELAQKYGVDPEEARSVTERVLMAENDPLRERRIRDLAARVAEGTYQVDADQVVDMAERRAIADRVR